MGLLFCMLHGSDGHKVSNMCIGHDSVLKAYMGVYDHAARSVP
jgi:hypothetical protein